MPIDQWVNKFFKFPWIEKETYKEFLLSNEIDMWGCFFTLYPPTKQQEIYIWMCVNKLSVFDEFENKLMAVEIQPEEYASVAKIFKSDYRPFYPSGDISDFM